MPPRVVTERPVLPLDYDPAIDGNVLRLIETTARHMGVPLDQLEMLGQDADTGLAFVAAADNDLAWDFLESVDWDCLWQKYCARRDASKAHAP